MENYNEGYLYKDSYSEKEFLDAVFKYIKDDILSPTYIFDEMSCSEVFRINIPLILSDGKSEIEYSRMIGYDSYVTTTKYKTTTYSNGYQNKTQSSSTRTVTDWKKDYGTLTGTASSGYFDEKYLIYDEYVTNHLMDKSNIRLLTIDELNEYPLTSEVVDFLKNDILNKVFANNITYPGQHVKNEEYYGETTLYNTSLTIVSLYAVTISARDKSFTFIACSNGDIDLKMFGDYPADNYDNVINFNREITAQRKEATKTQRANAKYTIFSSIALFVLLLSLGIALDVLALTITSIVILTIGFIIGFRFIHEVKIISKPYYKQIYDYNIKDLNNRRIAKEESYDSFIKKLH